MEQNYIDLGLRLNGNKILFADHNLGASKHEEYGDMITLEDIPAVEERIRKEFGEGWRLPDYDELNLLLSDTVNREWDNNYKKTNKTGLKIKGKDSFSNTTMFLPAAGCITKDKRHIDTGEYGHYWSKTLYEDFLYENDQDSSWNLRFRDDDNYMVYDYCYFGQSIRPVLVMPE